MKTEPDRRRFFKQVAASGFALALPGQSQAGESAPPTRDLGFFTDTERKALISLSEIVLPGSSGLGSVSYIELLLTAFDVDPPRIYASGPFSGRTPYAASGGGPSSNFPSNSFAEFLPLNRVQRLSWQLKLFGSAGVQGGGPNDTILGATTGLRDTFKAGLKEALSLSFGSTSKESLALVHPFLKSAFKDALRDLVSESAYAAPEYGGNQGLGGWQSIHFEGDVLPLGYTTYVESTGAYVERSDAPTSQFDSGTDPDKMGFLTRLMLGAISLILGGKIHRGRTLTARADGSFE